MRAIEQFADEAREVVRRLKASPIRDAEALLLTEQGVYPVKGLLTLLNNPDKYEATALCYPNLPKPLYSDTVFLYPFADVAEKVRAPFGADTVFAIRTRKSRISDSAKSGRSGV
jgi:hypothetical protein